MYDNLHNAAKMQTQTTGTCNLPRMKFQNLDIELSRAGDIEQEIRDQATKTTIGYNLE